MVTFQNYKELTIKNNADSKNSDEDSSNNDVNGFNSRGSI